MARKQRRAGTVRRKPAKVAGKSCESYSWHGWLVLLLGVLFLGQDLKWWTFFAVEGWTVVLLLFGLHGLLRK